MEILKQRRLPSLRIGGESGHATLRQVHTGQKLWYLIVVVGGLVLFLMGLLMWFGKGYLPTWVLQWSVFLHDLFAIAMSAFFLVHFIWRWRIP